MFKRPHSLASKIFAGILVFGLLFGIAAWRLLTPKINTATMAEVLALVPKELQETVVVDRSSAKRYDAFIKIAQDFDQKQLEPLFSKKLTSSVRFAAAQSLVATKKDSISKLEATIDDGPFQYSPKHPDMKPLTQVKGLVKALGASGLLFAVNRDFKTAVKFLSLSVKVSDRFIASDGDMIQYLVGAALQAVSTRSIEEALLTPKFPVESCQQLLHVLTPAPGQDNVLRATIRSEFQRYSLSYLPDPTKRVNELLDSMTDPSETSKEELPATGTYEAVETTKLVSAAVQTDMRNAIKPYSQYDHSSDEKIDKMTSNLPQLPNLDGRNELSKEWNKLRFRFGMNTMHNSLGRQLLALSLSTSTKVAVSDRWRANRDACRVLLASRIYRASHNNQLPPDTSGFIPLLGAWPRDPFSGGPLIYNNKTEKVYSVGENLKDEGGDVSFIPFKSKDFGVSLK